MIDEELKKAIIANKEVLENIDKRMHRIEKKLIWGTIFGYIKFFIIVSPLIFAAIYFTPILKDYVKIFEPVINTFRSSTGQILNPDNPQGGNTLEGAMLESFCEPDAREAMVRQLCK